MKRAFALVIVALCLLVGTGADAQFFGKGGSGSDSRIGTLTNTKWCYSDGSQIICTEDAPAGAGDITAVGSCTTGDCSQIGNADTSGGYLDFLEDSDNGTNYVRIGAPPSIASNYTLYLPVAAIARGSLVIGSSTANTLGYLTIGASGKILTTNGTDPSWSSFTVAEPGAANAILASDGTNWVRVTTFTGNVTGNADTATALASNPTDCASNTFANAIAASGNLTCSSVPAAALASADFGSFTCNGTSCTIDSQAVSAAMLANADFGDFTVSSGTATIDTGAVTVGKLATSMTIGATSLWDYSAITHSNTDVKGLQIPSCGTAQNPTSGANFVCWDTAASSFKVYDSGWKAFATTAAPVDVSYLTLGASATLTAERVLTEGTAIDFVDGGANSTLTINFDSTELGTTTWGSGSAIVWTFDASGGTDVTLTFGNNLLTVGGGLTLSTGKNFIIGTTTWNSGDSIDGTKVANADLGDISVSSGVWSVEDDSHAHTSASITLASTNLSDTANIALLDAANTFTGNNVFGNGDTDTLTIRSMIIGGNSRAVQIAASVASPTYATGTNELYVAGDIESGGSIYANAFITGTGTDTQRRLGLTSNTSFDCSGYPDSIYFLNDALMFCNGTASKTPARLEDSQTFTGKKTFQGDIAVGDASNSGSIDIYDGSSNYWQIQVPSLSADYILILPSSAGTTGQYLTTTTSGSTATLSWGTPTATAHGSDTYVQFNDGGTALGSDAGFTYAKATQTLTIGKAGTDGKIVLYNELGTTDYNATIQPNSSQAADITITLPAVTGTLLTSAGSETWTGTQTYSAASNNSTVAVMTFSGSPAFNGSDVHRDIYLNHSLGTITSTGNTVALIDVAAMTGDAETNLYALRIGNLTGTSGSAGEVEYGISVGTGWDRGISTGSPLYVGDGTNGMTVGATGALSFAGTATFTTASATSSVPWVVGTATATNTAEGSAYWESDTDILTIGDGATRISLDFTADTFITFPSTSATLARTDAGQTFTGVNVFTAPTFTTSITPTVAGASTIGTTALEWGNVYLTDAAVIYGQADQSNSMTSSATGWTFNQPITLGPQTTTAGSIYFQEGSGGGTNKVRLQGPASTDDVTVTLPASAGTLMLTTGSPAAMVIASQATGDLLYASSNSAWARLGIQAAGYVLAGGSTPAWSNAPQITSIELGAASDTTIARSAAGVITVESQQVGYVQTATIDGSAHVHLTAAQMQTNNCIVTNLGQTTADVNIGLPAAAVGLSCLFTVATAQSNHWGVLAGAGDGIYIVAADGTISAKGDDAAAAVMTAAQLGQSFACWTQATGAGPAYDWFCKAIAIGTSTFAAHAAF
jgi:fibronectin-binding autotransporter adhesin